MTIKGILFDKDGTLLDFNRTWLPPYRRAAAFLQSRFGASADEFLARGGFIKESQTWRPDSPLASGSNAAIIDCWSEVAGAAIEGRDLRAVEAFFDLPADAYAPAVDGMRELLAELRASGFDGGALKLGVATMDNADNARRMLRAARIDALFDFVCGADSGYGVKPAPGMAHAFCDACGLPAARIMVVGDSPKDVDMGLNAGAGLTVGVLTGAHAAGELSCADCVLQSIAEVPALLREINSSAAK